VQGGKGGSSGNATGPNSRGGVGDGGGAGGFSLRRRSFFRSQLSKGRGRCAPSERDCPLRQSILGENSRKRGKKTVSGSLILSKWEVVDGKKGEILIKGISTPKGGKVFFPPKTFQFTTKGELKLAIWGKVWRPPPRKGRFSKKKNKKKKRAKEGPYKKTAEGGGGAPRKVLQGEKRCIREPESTLPIEGKKKKGILPRPRRIEEKRESSEEKSLGEEKIDRLFAERNTFREEKGK